MSVCEYSHISCGVKLLHGLYENPDVSLAALWLPAKKSTAHPSCSHNHVTFSPAYVFKGLHYKLDAPPSSYDAETAAFVIWSDRCPADGYGEQLAKHVEKHFPKYPVHRSEIQVNPNSHNQIRVYTWAVAPVADFKAYICRKEYKDFIRNLMGKGVQFPDEKQPQVAAQPNPFVAGVEAVQQFNAAQCGVFNRYR